MHGWSFAPLLSLCFPFLRALKSLPGWKIPQENTTILAALSSRCLQPWLRETWWLAIPNSYHIHVDPQDRTCSSSRAVLIYGQSSGAPVVICNIFVHLIHLHETGGYFVRHKKDVIVPDNVVHLWTGSNKVHDNIFSWVVAPEGRIIHMPDSTDCDNASAPTAASLAVWW